MRKALITNFAAPDRIRLIQWIPGDAVNGHEYDNDGQTEIWLWETGTGGNTVTFVGVPDDDRRAANLTITPAAGDVRRVGSLAIGGFAVPSSQRIVNINISAVADASTLLLAAVSNRRS